MSNIPVLRCNYSWIGVPPNERSVALVTQHIVAIRPQMAEVLKRIKSLVLDGVRSPTTRRAYDRVLLEFIAWCLATGADGLTKATA